MNNYIKILYDTKKTFQDLMENDNGNYGTRISWIFVLSGLVSGAIVLFDGDWSTNGIIAKIFPYVMLIIVRFLIYYFVFSYVLFWISNSLKGKGTIEQIRFILAYSLIPSIIILPLIIIQGVINLYGIDNQILNWILYIAENLLILYVFKILLIGLSSAQASSRWKGEQPANTLLHIPRWRASDVYRDITRA
jgi:hypothetical protein